MAQLRRLIRRLPLYAFVAVVLLYTLFPIYWLFLTSLKNPARLGIVSYWPDSASLGNYQQVLGNQSFIQALYMSLFVTAAVLAITMAFGAMAAYAIGRLPFRGRGTLRSVLITMTAVPHIALLAGLFPLITNPCSIFGGSCREVALYNTPWALISTYLILTLPLTVWFLSATFRDMPPELEEAARVDGATPFQSFARIALPLATPGMISTGLLAFITAWNEYLFAIFFTQDERSRTVPIAIANYGSNLGGIPPSMAASILGAGPVILLVLTFQRYISTWLTGSISTEEGELRRARPRWLPRLELGPAGNALVIAGGLAALAFCLFGWRAIRFPFPLDYGEGPLLDQAVRLARFENIYRADLSAPPFTVANYPPLYVLAQVPFVWLFGPAFWYGRLISWLSIVGAAGCVASVLHMLTRDRLATIAGGLTLLAIPYVSVWAPLNRIDSLALLLSTAALAVIVRWPDRRWGLIGCGLLLTAAIYTRQSYGLAAPLAAFAWLASRRPRRRAFALAGLVAGLGLALLGLLNALTGGGFWFDIVVANVNPFDTDLLRMYLGEMALLIGALVVAAAIFLVAGAWLRAPSWPLIGAYLLGAAISGLTIGKVGSNVNYFLEFSAALALAVGALLALLGHWPFMRNGLALVLALQLFLLAPGSQYHLRVERKLSSEDEQAALLIKVQVAPGPVLADEEMGLLPLAGRPILLQPFELKQLADADEWDERALLDQIDRREFAMILIFQPQGFPLHRERWTPAMLEHIGQAYAANENIGGTVVYRPKGEAP